MYFDQVKPGHYVVKYLNFMINRHIELDQIKQWFIKQVALI